MVLLINGLELWKKNSFFSLDGTGETGQNIICETLENRGMKTIHQCIHRKPHSRNKIWYLFSILLVVTSTHQQTNDVQHYNGRHCAEHRSVPNDVEFLENRRKIDRVRWNEERRCEVIPWGILTITNSFSVICLRGYLYKEKI